ncbi:MAG: ACT domain-containing protein [Anaerolineales bacterium]|nr:ACT domain-containing protein [Anaerolineales bacterium]
MVKDIAVLLEDSPGALAKLGEALGKAEINIEGVAGMTVVGKGVIHLLVEEAQKARRALEANDIDVEGEREVLLIDVQDRPGVLGNIARRLARENVNIELAYLATSNRLVLGVDDEEKARRILKID